MLWIYPVSYTHLDVYKRQLLKCHRIGPDVVILGNPVLFFGNLLNKGNDFPFQCFKKFIQRLHGKAFLIIIPVSYTHLDVYKRQPLTGMILPKNSNIDYRKCKSTDCFFIDGGRRRAEVFEDLTFKEGMTRKEIREKISQLSLILDLQRGGLSGL